MKKEIKTLNELTGLLKKMNSKILFIRLLKQAKAEYEKYKLDDSLKSLEDAYALNSQSSAVLRGFGCIAQAEGNWNKAVEYYNRALQYSENKEIEYTLLGMAYYFQEDLDKALEYFNSAIDENDNYPFAYEGRNQAMLEHHLKILDLQEALDKNFRL